MTLARGGSAFGPVVLFRLVALFDQKALIIIASTIAIAAQAAFSTAFMAIHADEWGKLAAMAPIPGPSFKGCFPVLSQEDSRAVWFSAMTVQSLAMITAVFLTIRTWWMGDSPSFLALAQRNGIFHFMAITSSTVFAKAFFSLAPKSLVLAATPVTMVVYSFFGSLLLLNLHEQQSSQLDPQAELSTYLSRSEINGAGLNAKSGKDLELGLPNAAGLSKKVHRTPESEATLALSPPVTVTSRQHQASPVIEKQSPMPTPPSAMVPSEQVSINQLRADNIIVEEGQPPKAVLPTLGTMTSNSSLSRHYSSQDSPNTDGIETLQEQQIEWTALEEALAEEYDEDGKRRRPRRTHERKWKSDEPVIVTPPTFPFPVSQEPRPPGVNFSSPGETLMSPILASTFNSDTVIPSSSLTKPPSQTKKVLARSRLSGLLHRRQPLQASKHTSTHVPTSVPEGVVDVSPGPVSLPTPDSPSQPLHRSSSTRRSSQSYTARLRRLPAMSGGSISPGLARARTQGESDGATVSSASTGWAFDNNNTRDAPDFGN
ncbi:hypothetical protein FRB94_010942 [Tulasnella sp. JGI-2019a]|nr:hypothetical protein FRB94_010942 [Tulasnella sp. JGI-2019a]